MSCGPPRKIQAPLSHLLWSNCCNVKLTILMMPCIPVPETCQAKCQENNKKLKNAEARATSAILNARLKTGSELIRRPELVRCLPALGLRYTPTINV